MGALTVTTPYARPGKSDVRAAFNDNLFLLPFTFTFSTSYATNGDTIATMPAGYKDLISPWAIGAPAGYGLQLDVANSKLKVFTASATGAVEVTNATNLQTVLGAGAQTVFFLCR